MLRVILRGLYSPSVSEDTLTLGFPRKLPFGPRSSTIVSITNKFFVTPTTIDQDGSIGYHSIIIYMNERLLFKVKKKFRKLKSHSEVKTLQEKNVRYFVTV